MANKYVKNAREGAKGTDGARKHKRTQGRKIQEDADKTKEKHGMKPHPHPIHKQAHTFSIGDDNESYTRYDKYVTEKKTQRRLPRPLYRGNAR